MIIQVSPELLAKIAEVEENEASKTEHKLHWSWAYYEGGNCAYGEAGVYYPYCGIDITITDDGAEIYRTEKGKYGDGETYTHELSWNYEEEEEED